MGNATLKWRNSSLFQHFCAGRLGAKLHRTQIWVSRSLSSAVTDSYSSRRALLWLQRRASRLVFCKSVHKINCSSVFSHEYQGLCSESISSFPHGWDNLVSWFWLILKMTMPRVIIYRGKRVEQGKRGSTASLIQIWHLLSRNHGYWALRVGVPLF